MSRLARLLILTLVAAWLPVTLHCRLEAAGFYDDEACCAGETAATAPAGECHDNTCPTVENALYKESARDLQIPAPALTTCLVCLASLPFPEPTADPDLSPARHAAPPELEVSWQFIARAAPPARAPSLNT